jgi:carboxymethylenebutenolidase
MNEIAIASHDGESFKGYLATPPSGRGPGLLLFHAIFGVNAVVRDYADAYASQGYVVLCPDLFWRQQAGVSLSEQKPEDMKRGMDLLHGFDVNMGLEDLKSSLTALRHLPGVSGASACVGYCFGGRMAYLMAAHTDIDAAVSYYGTAIEKHLDLASRVNRPLMLHLPADDSFVPPEVQRAIQSELADSPNVIIHVYPGVGHAFARVGSPNYNAAVTKVADERTRRFLKQHTRA